LEGYPEALPFYDRNVPEVGILRGLENGESVSQQAAFEQLQEGEASVRFNPETGSYEFLDEGGNILRTKEIFKAPETAPTIEGLAYNHEDGKYYTEAGNPYGLEVGAYAGEKIEYNHGEETGVVLLPAVVKVLMEQANTSEAIAAGNWKIPFPLDARGESGLVIGRFAPGILRLVDFKIGGISPNATFVSPFTEERVVDWVFSPHTKSPAMAIQVPIDFSGGRDWGLVITVPTDTQGPVEGEVVSFGSPILWGIQGELNWRGAPLEEVQALACVAPQVVDQKSDFDITDNILMIDDAMVFLAGSS